MMTVFLIQPEGSPAELQCDTMVTLALLSWEQMAILAAFQSELMVTQAAPLCRTMPILPVLLSEQTAMAAALPNKAMTTLIVYQCRRTLVLVVVQQEKVAAKVSLCCSMKARLAAVLCEVRTALTGVL